MGLSAVRDSDQLNAINLVSSPLFLFFSKCFWLNSLLETVLKDLMYVVCSEKASPQGTTQMVPRPRDIRAISLGWNAAPWSFLFNLCDMPQGF